MRWKLWEGKTFFRCSRNIRDAFRFDLTIPNQWRNVFGFQYEWVCCSHAFVLANFLASDADKQCVHWAYSLIGTDFLCSGTFKDSTEQTHCKMIAEEMKKSFYKSLGYSLTQAQWIMSTKCIEYNVKQEKEVMQWRVIALINGNCESVR